MFDAKSHNELLEVAVAEIRAGRVKEGRTLLQRLLDAEPRNILALLWMTKCTQDLHERASLFKQASIVDPSNVHALKGLELYAAYLQPKGGIAQRPSLAGPVPSASDFEPTPPLLRAGEAAIPEANSRTNTLAVISLVAALISPLCVIALGFVAFDWLYFPSVVFLLVALMAAVVAIPVATGHIARRQIRSDSGPIRQTGDGSATAGLVIGYIEVGLFVCGVIALLLNFAPMLMGPNPLLDPTLMRLVTQYPSP